MDKAQLEYLIQKIMEQCVRDDYFVKKQITLPLLHGVAVSCHSPLLHKTNVQQSAELKLQPIQNQVGNINDVNLSFTEKYINNIYDFFYNLIHHEKYRYMDDYLSSSNNNGQEPLNSYAYAIKFIFKPIIQKLKNKQSCNASSNECNSNTATASVDIFGFVVLLVKITIYLIQSGYCKKSDDGESNVDWMIGTKDKKKLDNLFDYCFNEIKSAFLSEQLIGNLTSLQHISKTTYDYNDFLIYWKSNFNHIQSVVCDILDFDKQTIDKLLTLISNENQLLDSKAASLLEQLIHKRMENNIIISC